MNRFSDVSGKNTYPLFDLKFSTLKNLGVYMQIIYVEFTLLL